MGDLVQFLIALVEVLKHQQTLCEQDAERQSMEDLVRFSVASVEALKQVNP